MKPMFSLRTPLSAALLVATTIPFNTAIAQNTTETVNDIDTIVVTAGRREQAISDVQASVEVITNKELMTFSGSSVTEALRQAVGVDARSSGANSTVSIRGQKPNAGSAVLILFDGLPRTGKFGLTNLNNYPVADVERIEVIRGPLSALYGANASGGVINVITKKAGEGAPLSIQATTGTSTSKKGDGRDTYNLSASLNGMTGKVGHRASIQYYKADPFRFNDTIGGDDLTGVEHLSLTYSGQTPTGETGNLRWTLETFMQDDRGNAQTRSLINYESIEKEDRYYGSLAWDEEVGPGTLSLEASHGFSDGAVNRSFPGPDETTEFTQSLAQTRYLVPIENHSVLVGGGIQRDKIDVSILNTVGKETNVFAYMQDEWDIVDDIRLVAGIRYDYFQAFGSQVEPRISIGSRGNGLTWRIGYGEAYRAPSVIEQFASFNRGRFLIVGVPNIKPEETKTKELAIGWRSKRGNVELVYHASDIKNLIQAAPDGTRQNNLIVYAYQNIAEASISGFELTGTYDLGLGFSADGSYEYLDAVEADTDIRLNGRAKDTFKLGLTYENGPWATTARGRRISSLIGIDPFDRARPAFTSNYTTFDLQAHYNVNESLRISLGIDNLTDERVPLNWSSTGAIEDPAGRYAYLTLGYTFGGR